MQILPISNNSTNINKQDFGKKVLDKVHLKKITKDGSYKLIKGYISELEADKLDDIYLVGRIKDKWERYTTYGDDIIDNFQSRKNITNLYMTEIKKAYKNIKENICCLVETTNPKRNPKDREHFFINYIQSAPDIANLKDKSPIKGAGELAMYEAVKVAKKEKYQDVMLHSVNDSFYDKMGFEKFQKETYNPSSDSKIALTYYKLPKEKFKEFLDRIEQKYQFGKYYK